MLWEGVFHFFAFNVVFSFCIDHPSYEINPFYFYKIQQCAFRQKTCVRKSILIKMRAVGTLY